MRRTFTILAALFLAGLIPYLLSSYVGAQSQNKSATSAKKKMPEKITKVVKTDEEWREKLTDMQFKVTRKAGTERSFTGKYWDNKADGQYNCICCDLPLFDAKAKFKSGTGWPSFFQPTVGQNVATKVDRSLFSTRTEVLCARCDAHLGHVFEDGPQPTGLRYCMNSASLNFVSREDLKAAEEKAKPKADGSDVNGGSDKK